MKDQIKSDAEVKTDYWSGYKGMEVYFPKLAPEISGKKKQDFKQTHREIKLFKAWLRVEKCFFTLQSQHCGAICPGCVVRLPDILVGNVVRTLVAVKK